MTLPALAASMPPNFTINEKLLKPVLRNHSYKKTPNKPKPDKPKSMTKNQAKLNGLNHKADYNNRKSASDSVGIGRMNNRSKLEKSKVVSAYFSLIIN